MLLCFWIAYEMIILAIVEKNSSPPIFSHKKVFAGREPHEYWPVPKWLVIRIDPGREDAQGKTVRKNKQIFSFA